jgi:hypothetical protein
MKRFPIGNPIRASHERGGILVIAIIVILAMLIMAIPFLFKLSGQWRTTEKSSHSLAAFNLAEAGVERTMYYLDPDSPVVNDRESIVWTNGGTNLVGAMKVFKDASADAKVIGDVNILLGPPYGTDPPRRSLDSTGVVPFIADRPVDRSVRVTLEQVYNSIFDVGFFVDKYFYIHSGFLLDAYNSDPASGGGAYGGTNSHLPDVIFGSNSYIEGGNNPNDPGEATWIIDAGGGSSDIYGTVIVGGTASEAGTLPADANAYDDNVISAPDGVLDTSGNGLMKQHYDLPPVDVYDLPPKDILGSIPSVGDWFYDYNATTPEDSGGYYQYRMDRAPIKEEIELNARGLSADQDTFSGSGTLTPDDSGVYTSFVIGGPKTSGTLNISGGDVVIYVTSYGTEGAQAASFYMGDNSSINIADGSSLTLILGNASFSVEKGYNINAQGNPPQASDCVILGTNQFTIPGGTNLDNLGNKASTVDNKHIPGLVYFEHGTKGDEAGTVYSAMYVPGAHVTTGLGQNHLDYYGALISASMDFKVQVDFHYDKALADLKIVTGGYKNWKIISWQEVIQ